MSKPTLWHYTCDHGRDAIGEAGALIPRESRIWTSGLVWLTDLDVPIRDGLGLTSHILDCDRTAHRYRVTGPATCVRWTDIRRQFPGAAGIESAPGAMPAHWWISREPVPVRLDERATP